MITVPQEADMLELMAIIRETSDYKAVNEQLSAMQFNLLYQKLTDVDKQRRLEDYTPCLSEEQLERLKVLFGESLGEYNQVELRSMIGEMRWFLREVSGFCHVQFA